jgi:hypothetical protein
MKFRLRSLMAAVAIVAILLSLPVVALQFAILYVTVLAALILVPAVLAPRERRIETADWALALHPIALLVWLSVWRFYRYPGGLYPEDKGRVNTLLIDTPYALSYLTRFCMPLLGVLAWGLAAYWFPRRSTTKPLLVLPIVWIMTLVALACDPFRPRDWFWD